MKQAQDGIDKMREHVDTILIISNDKLRQQFGNLPFTQAFAKADDILATAAKCITDVITTTGQINVDFADVCTVMKNGGVAILGSASAVGENRATQAVEEALNSPLLNDSDISGAKWLLLNITSAAGEFEHTMDEAEAIQAYVQQQAGDNCDVILGMGHDPNLKERIAVTVIATGFNHKDIKIDMPAKNNEPEKIVVKLGDIQSAETRPAETWPYAKQTSMAPVLVEAPVAVNPVTESKPFEQQMPLPSDHFLQLVEEKKEVVAETAPPAYTQEARKSDEIPMQIVIKDEPAKEVPMMKIGERILTADEIEEKKRFEEQKRSLEDRAERLRRMSFNIKGTESSDEMESVPAYMRKNLKLDNQAGSSDSYYSGYSVGVNDQQNNQQAAIQTINTFLDGKKPD